MEKMEEKLQRMAPVLTDKELQEINGLFTAYTFRRSKTRELWTTCCGKHKVIREERATAAHRRVNTMGSTRADTQQRASRKPNSSPTTPNTRSVLAAPTYLSQPASGPTPNRPPEAIALMVRVCW